MFRSMCPKRLILTGAWDDRNALRRAGGRRGYPASTGGASGRCAFGWLTRVHDEIGCLRLYTMGFYVGIRPGKLTCPLENQWLIKFRCISYGTASFLRGHLFVFRDKFRDVEMILVRIHPGRLTWNIIPWRFGEKIIFLTKNGWWL